MEDRTPRLPSDQPRPRAQRFAKSAAPALIAGAAIALISGALLLIIAGLDAFNATVYSVNGNSISDSTDEARQIRELYSGARTGALLFLVLALLSAVTGGIILYLNRRGSHENGGSDGDVDFEDLGR